ncbi:MAG: T9SS type A sorting domain-containing protein [Chitinophagaceae bacterium]
MFNVNCSAFSSNSSKATPGWYSAMWKLVNPVTASSAIVPVIQNATTDDRSVQENAIRMFPNPSTGKQFFVDVSAIAGNGAATVTVSDLSGKLLLQQKGQGLMKIEHRFTAGLYVVQISSQKQQVTKRLVVQ